MIAPAASLLATALLLADATDDLAGRFEQARVLFDSGRYPEAAAAFERLQTETGEPALLYPGAQSLRLAGRCGDALRAYEAFVAAAPDLRARSDAAKPGSGAKRWASDLGRAAARVIEMRVCLGRARATAARIDSQHLAAAGNQAGALIVLDSAWNETQDPTLLPDLAAAQKIVHACSQAGATLDLAGRWLAPLEALADDAAPGADLLAARRALQQSRTAAADQTCIDVPAPAATGAIKLAAHLDPRDVTPPPIGDRPMKQVAGEKTKDAGDSGARARPAWPLLGAAAGGAVALAGGVFIWKALDEIHQSEATARMKNVDASHIDELARRGHRDNVIGLALGAGGVVVGAAATLFYFSSRNLSATTTTTTTAGLQVSASRAVVEWTLLF